MKSIISIYIGCGLFLMSCQESESLTPEQNYIADTLYSSQQTALRLQGDSLCKIYKDSFYLKAVDSLQDEYLDNIEYYFRK
ncbi:MAG: hypothetical protein WAT79_13460 [Saprospiraceae bacterium]